ncbi:hypothetical protein DVH05_024849 [Phytophthora capsici]|nr:hypothetical protein DVH05_024849 [Phytophthora capsici]
MAVTVTDDAYGGDAATGGFCRAAVQVASSSCVALGALGGMKLALGQIGWRRNPAAGSYATISSIATTSAACRGWLQPSVVWLLLIIADTCTDVSSETRMHLHAAVAQRRRPAPESIRRPATAALYRLAAKLSGARTSISRHRANGTLRAALLSLRVHDDALSARHTPSAWPLHGTRFTHLLESCTPPPSPHVSSFRKLLQSASTSPIHHSTVLTRLTAPLLLQSPPQ